MGIKYRYFTKKKSYSQFAEDLILKEIFGNFVGKYVDIGCFHPVRYSNTYFLFKKGWEGINIDVNQTSIDLFDIARPNDKNICAAISDKVVETNLYEDDILGPVNTIEKKIYEKSKGIFFKKRIVKKIKDL